MDWGAMGRAGTGRSPSPRGTKGLGVARASAEAATVSSATGPWWPQGARSREVTHSAGSVGASERPPRARCPSICPRIFHRGWLRRK